MKHVQILKRRVRRQTNDGTRFTISALPWNPGMFMAAPLCVPLLKRVGFVAESRRGTQNIGFQTMGSLPKLRWLKRAEFKTSSLEHRTSRKWTVDANAMPPWELAEDITNVKGLAILFRLCWLISPFGRDRTDSQFGFGARRKSLSAKKMDPEGSDESGSGLHIYFPVPNRATFPELTRDPT